MLRRKVLAATVSATAAAFALAPGAAIAEESNANSPEDNKVREFTEKVYDAWINDVMTVNARFNDKALTGSESVKRAIVASDDDMLMAGLEQSDKDYAKALKDPKKLSDLKSAPDKFTPVETDDGRIVTALPFGDVSVSNGHVTVNKLKTGLEIKSPDSGEDIPFVIPNETLHLFFTKNGDQNDNNLVNSIKSALTVVDNKLVYGDGDNEIPLNNGSVSALRPDKDVELTQHTNVVNNFGESLTSIVEAYAPAKSEGEDKADGRKDGLSPIKNSRTEEKLKPGNNDAKQKLKFKVPKTDENVVYINHRIETPDGEVVVPQSMDVVEVSDPVIDVQASTDDASSKLSDGKQKIYNEVRASQLTTGKPYQVLVNLYQCDGPDECKEIAAVNREIIPETSVRSEFFSVEVDADKLKNKDATFEWTTRLYEGTGDVKKMGDELASVADHPKSQVLSFSGNAEGLGSEKVNVEHASTVNVNAQEGEGESKDDLLDVGDDAPPAPMEQVRENNEKNAEESQEQRGMFTNETVGWIALGVLVLIGAAGAIGVFARNNGNKETSQEANNG